MDEPVFEVDDAVVLLLGAPSKQPQLTDRLQGVTRLEKMIFLMEHETSLSDRLTEKPEFIAYNFGPFSAKVYQAVDTLAAADLITDSAASTPSEAEAWESFAAIDDAAPDDPYATRDFQLTPRGRRYYDALVRQLPPEAVQELSQLKARFGSLPLRQLVRYVYERYPAYTERSLIRDEIIGGDR